MWRNNFLALLCCALLFACAKSEDSFYAEDVPPLQAIIPKVDTPDFLLDIGKINIQVTANGNYAGSFESAFFKDISGTNHSYCHPDVQYFPNGFNGYKYWMVFTPYFGYVGTTQESKRYENPTVVVSNDGLNWVSPLGIISPLMRTPSARESFLENKQDPRQGFWSDVDWVYVNNKFYLYYRGSFITAQTFKNKCVKSKNNTDKLKTNAHRTIVQQTSVDGIRWTPLEIAYTSNAPFSPKNNHVLSPTMIHNGSRFISYEVELNTGDKNFKGKELSYIIQRISADGLNFSLFKQSKIVNFVNMPWKKVDENYAPWHIQAAYVDGYYFLCLAVGNVKKYTADALYLAYSKDGINFVVLAKPMVEKNVYRSAIFPMKSNNETIDFGAVIGFKSGEFKYREFKLDKQKLESALK
ncbi:hypothetical protein [Sphingobacterium spiritivorum]|uniref:hypothetical protein n=1 Tax=Sphingobacterium spiritivorum TaxID=258 RepID=UPI003DA3BFB6